MGSAAPLADGLLKSMGKSVGSGALSALGGFAVSSIMTAIIGDPMADQLKEIGQQLKGISAQLAKIDETLKELININNSMLTVLKGLLKAKELERLTELQTIFVRIETYHKQLAESAGNIDENGKPRVKREVLQKNIEGLIEDMKRSGGRSSLREDFNQIDAILFGATEINGMVDVVIKYLREDVRKGTVSLDAAMDRLEEFIRWCVWGQYKALRLLLNIEVNERAEKDKPTATETALLKDMTDRLDQLSVRLVMFAESMADERNRNAEFFGGLSPDALFQEPSTKPWKQLTGSVMSRADRVRDTLLGRSTVVVRFIPHLPVCPTTAQRGPGGRAPDLRAILIEKPFPTLQVVAGGIKTEVTPLGDSPRSVVSQGLDFQRPVATHGLYFFVYECEIENRLKGTEVVDFEVKLTAASEAVLPTYRHTSKDLAPHAVLVPIQGKIGGEAGGASVSAMMYAYTSEPAAARTRFMIRSLELPNYVWGADPVKKRVKLVLAEMTANAFWTAEPRAGGGGYTLVNVGTGLTCFYRGGNQSPVELTSDAAQLTKLGDKALWKIGPSIIRENYHPLAAVGERGQYVSALVSDIEPHNQYSIRGLFRPGTDEIRTLGADVLGFGSHLQWGLETVDGSKDWKIEL